MQIHLFVFFFIRKKHYFPSVSRYFCAPNSVQVKIGFKTYWRKYVQNVYSNKVNYFRWALKRSWIIKSDQAHTKDQIQTNQQRFAIIQFQCELVLRPPFESFLELISVCAYFVLCYAVWKLVKYFWNIWIVRKILISGELCRTAHSPSAIHSSIHRQRTRINIFALHISVVTAWPRECASNIRIRINKNVSIFLRRWHFMKSMEKWKAEKSAAHCIFSLQPHLRQLIILLGRTVHFGFPFMRGAQHIHWVSCIW